MTNTTKMSKLTRKKIGSLITNLREQRGLTQTDLAKALHTSQSAVARMEKGEQNFSTEMILKVGSILKRDIITLAGEAIDFKITGGRKLKGSIQVNKSKNAAVALLIASLLNKGKTLLKNMPQIAEVERIIEVLESLGVEIRWINRQDVEISPPEKLRPEKLNMESAKKTRSIIMLLGPLIHYFSRFSLPQAGGCRLGKRSVRPHFFALDRFGVKIKTTEDAYEINIPKLKAAEVVLYEAGDTVTENAIMAAARIPKKSVIKFASSNYMVQDLCFFLQKLGVKIEGIGTSTLIIYGKEEINKDVVYYPSEDPIEAMFFVSAALTTGSEIKIERCPIDFLELELLKLEKMGMKYSRGRIYKADNGKTNLVDLRIKPSRLKAIDEKIHPQPYPGINIDNLPFFVPIATQAQGRTLIHDWVYEDRVKYFTELNKLGADVVMADLHRVFIYGPTKLRAAKIVCPPALRPAAIILIGMLAAPGVSYLRNVYSINRGYEDLAQRLNKMGAKIEILRGL